jgi:hypothetical protein
MLDLLDEVPQGSRWAELAIAVYKYLDDQRGGSSWLSSSSTKRG